MPLSLLSIARPGRAASLAVVTGALLLLHGVVALRWPAALAWACAGLLAASLAFSGLALGLLAPLRGAGVRSGLRLARAGVALLVLDALLAPVLGTERLLPLRVAGIALAYLGIRWLARARRRDGDLPVWAYRVLPVALAVAAGAPSAGGALVLGAAWLAVASAVHAAHHAWTRLPLAQ